MLKQFLAAVLGAYVLLTVYNVAVLWYPDTCPSDQTANCLRPALDLSRKYRLAMYTFEGERKLGKLSSQPFWSVDNMLLTEPFDDIIAVPVDSKVRGNGTLWVHCTLSLPSSPQHSVAVADIPMTKYLHERDMSKVYLIGGEDEKDKQGSILDENVDINGTAAAAAVTALKTGVPSGAIWTHVRSEITLRLVTDSNLYLQSQLPRDIPWSLLSSKGSRTKADQYLQVRGYWGSRYLICLDCARHADLYFFSLPLALSPLSASGVLLR